MLRLASRQLWTRRLASGLTIGALACALAGAVALAAVSDRTTADLRGSVGAAWRSPFDLLVRPAGAATVQERDAGLVRPNYLTGIIGGITGRQLAAVRAVPDVVVAAPVAIVGYAEWPGQLSIDPARLTRGRPVSLLRLRARVQADAGLSHFPRAVRPEYLRVAPHGTLVDHFAPGPGSPSEALEVGGRRFPCANPDQQPSARRPRCQGAHLKIVTPEGVQRESGDRDRDRRLVVPFRLPLLVGGVDPRAEAELTGLDHCLTSGHYLRAAPLRAYQVRHPLLAVERIAGDWDLTTATDIPLLASTRSFLDERVTTIVERREGHAWRRAATERQTAEDLYRRSLGQVGRLLLANGTLVAAGDVRYEAAGPERLRAVARPPLFSALDNPVFGELGTGRIYGPVETHDVWMRQLSGRQLDLSDVASSRFRLRGRYDPGCLPGFDPLAGARLDVAAPPQVTLPDGRALLPTRSPAGYVTPPPLMLTTLEGARYFADPGRYSGAPGAAYISAIRVRVRGVARPDEQSRHRLEAVALAIRRRTGLRVDVVKGASVQTVRVALPAGRFGRPALELRERWSLKGVALRFADAIGAQSLGLLATALLTALLLTGESAHISVRRRRHELAALRALGWARRDLVRLVATECLLVGTCAGALATAAGVALGARSAVVALPAGALLALTAGVLPALHAGHGPVTARLRRGARPRLSRPPRNAAGAGVKALRFGWRADALLAVIAIAMGTAAVGGVALVAAGFDGHLDATLLGRRLRADAGAPQVTAAVLSALMAVAVGGQVVLMSYLERRRELACLRALGWPGAAVRSFVAAQGIALALAAAALAAAAIGAGAALLGASAAAAAVAVGTTAAVALVIGAASTALPLLLIRRSLAESLHDV